MLTTGLMSGCASAGAARAEASAGQTAALPETCAAFVGRRAWMNTDPSATRVGTTVRIRAWVREEGGPPEFIPAACMRDWKILPEGAARLSPDRTELIIGADAPAGQKLLVTAEAPGGFTHTESLLVGREEVVLTGHWVQAEVDCPAGPGPRETIRELEFDNEGRFSVTWYPFKNNKDYWGDARFDAAGKTLSLTVTGGNNRQPDLLLSGPAEIDRDGRLVLDGFYLGDHRPEAPPTPCRYVFRKP